MKIRDYTVHAEDARRRFRFQWNMHDPAPWAVHPDILAAFPTIAEVVNGAGTDAEHEAVLQPDTVTPIIWRILPWQSGDAIRFPKIESSGEVSGAGRKPQAPKLSLWLRRWHPFAEGWQVDVLNRYLARHAGFLVVDGRDRLLASIIRDHPPTEWQADEPPNSFRQATRARIREEAHKQTTSLGHLYRMDPGYRWALAEEDPWWHGALAEQNSRPGPATVR